jgi:hypothetical protein
MANEKTIYKANELLVWALKFKINTVCKIYFRQVSVIMKSYLNFTMQIVYILICEICKIKSKEGFSFNLNRML